MLQQSQQLTHRVQAAEKELAALEPWGDFDPQNISRLRKAGYQTGFYICSEKQFKPEWVDLYHATVINRIGSKMYFVTVTKGMVLPELEVETAKLPDSSLSALQVKVADLKAQQTALQEKLKDLAATAIPDLKAAQHQVHSQIEFSKVVLSTDALADNKLMLLEGWILRNVCRK